MLIGIIYTQHGIVVRNTSFPSQVLPPTATCQNPLKARAPGVAPRVSRWKAIKIGEVWSLKRTSWLYISLFVYIPRSTISYKKAGWTSGTRFWKSILLFSRNRYRKAGFLQIKWIYGTLVEFKRPTSPFTTRNAILPQAKPFWLYSFEMPRLQRGQNRWDAQIHSCRWQTNTL